MKQFVKFTEDNEWEGETWTHWLQVDGNEEQLAELWNLLVDADPGSSEDFPFHLADFEAETLSEHDVDVLVKHAGGDGYMAAQTKGGRRGGEVVTPADPVGPLPTIHFQDGTRLAYQPPRNTLDNRYAACTDHHPACDCREAWMAESRQEMLAEQRAAVDAAREVLRGHVTFAWLPNGETDYARRCQCTGCQIARSAFLLTPWHQVKAGVPTQRPADWEAPR